MDATSAPSPAAEAPSAGTGSGGVAAPGPLDVSALPPLGTLLDRLSAPLALWMPAQRWYAHKSAGAPQMRISGWAPLRIAPDHLVVLTVVTAALAGGAAAHYQVPLVLRRATDPSPEPDGAEQGALIGTVPAPGGPLCALDAARDADGRTALLDALVAGDGAVGPGLALAPHRAVPGAPAGPGRARRTRVLSGEQSNTSLIVETEGEPPLIVKLFRVLQDGQNPDVVLQGALTAAGSTRVPALRGSAMIRTDALRTHALLAQEFLPGVEDAWRLSLRLAAAGEDVAEAMSDLGAAVAEVHRDLARSLGTSPADPAAVSRTVEGMRQRLAAAAEEVPAVAGHRAALETLLARALEVPWPPLQRLHGDLHLGQVLLAPARGWVLLDFEGEPLRPLARRSDPDCPLRDVAGILRSLDYVAGSVRLESGIDATAWAADARAAFLAGYGNVAADAPDAGARTVLLAAFEADKAVYEALYEVRNRPQWLPIPLAALERISAPVSGAGSGG